MGMSWYFPIPFQDTTSASSQPQKDVAPPCIPYPQALVTLHDLLRRRKTTLVNVFKKAGMEGRNIKKADFIKIIKQVWRAQESNKLLQLHLLFLCANPESFPTCSHSAARADPHLLQAATVQSCQDHIQV